MEIVLMGTACAETGAERDNTYLLLYESRGSTLVDVGGSPLSKLKKLGVPLDHIQRVVFTHFHIDHIYGFPSLLWGMWLAGRTEPLDVYCSSSEKKWLEDWIHLIGTKHWPVAFEIFIHPFDWQSPVPLWSGPTSALSVFPGLHGVPAVGVCYEKDGKVMVYSSDSTVNPHIRTLDHIDLLLHECTTAEDTTDNHSSLQQIADGYDWHKIDRAVMVHLTDGENYGEVLGRLPEPVRKKITFGKDLMRIKL